MKNFIRKLILKITEWVTKQQRFHAFGELEKNSIIHVGKGTYGQMNIEVDEYKGSERKIHIGNYCSISKNVRIITGGIHPPQWVSLYPFRIRMGLKGAYTDGMPASKGDINIGSDVWIGTGVTILSGVTIGDGAIVFSNALVSKSIPPYAMAAGVPAKVIGYRFPEEDIKELLEIKWWEWDEEKLQKAVGLLSSPDIKKFIETYKK